MNKWIGIGRICTDIDVRNTPNGKAVATYRLAVNRDFKKEGQPDADFITCVTFGKNAEFADHYLRKGLKIAVEGKIQTRNYEDRDGKKVYVTEIIVDHHEFCESKNVNSTNDSASYAQPAPAVSNTEFVAVDNDDDLPF